MVITSVSWRVELRINFLGKRLFDVIVYIFEKIKSKEAQTQPALLDMTVIYNRRK